MTNEKDTEQAVQAFSRFLGVIKKLREPDGCPWDKEQTPLSMRKDLMEESFEAVDAISEQNPAHAKEELGDVLLNTMMISYMYEQNGDFKISEEITELADKLIRRHPHVFPQSEGKICVNGDVKNPQEVLSQWDRIKHDVEGRRTERTVLDEIPQGFPPLLKAYKMQKKAGKLGFDWQELKPVVEKVYEELDEVQKAYSELMEERQNSKTEEEAFTKNSSSSVDKKQLHVEEEIGDLLFAVVNYARHLGVDPETALNRTNSKFYRRFAFVEQHMKKADIPMDCEHLEEEDVFWRQAKKQGL